MQTRRLGQTDILVSVIGLGTVKFGRNQGVKYPTAFNLPTDKEIAALLVEAQRLGVNLLDTAPAYGTSEERLGKALRGSARHEWVIVGKAGEEFINGESHFDFSRAAILSSIDRSLQRLQTDYLDCVLIHSNGDDERIIQEDGVFDTLALCKQAGKIRSFGMSTKTVAGGLLTVEQADVAMITYHPAYTDEKAVITKAEQEQKGILIKKALASGHLNQLAGEDPVSTSLRFILAEAGVSSIIIGTLNRAHLAENVRACLLSVDR